MQTSTLGLPISQRKRDWFFVIALSTFACTSLLSDTPHALGLERGPFDEMNAFYARAAGDAYFAENPPPLRMRMFISGLVYPLITAALARGFVRGDGRIQPLALMYSGAMIIGMIEFFGWEVLSGKVASNLPVFFCINGPYLVIPVLLAIRLWGPTPFGAGASEPAGTAVRP